MSNAVQKDIQSYPNSKKQNVVAVGNNHLPVISLLTIVLAGGAIISIRSNYPFGTLDAPGPGFYPLLVSIFLVVCGIIGLIEWATARNRHDKTISYEFSLKKISFPVFIILIALLGPVVYFAGFLISTIPAAMITAVLVRKKITVMTIVSMIVMPIIIFIAFDVLLGIPLP